MSASDYMCARVDCGKVAIAVRVTSHPTAFYGACAEHVRPLDGNGDKWLYAPPATLEDLIEQAQAWGFYSEAHPTIPYTAAWAVDLLRELLNVMVNEHGTVCVRMTQ